MTRFGNSICAILAMLTFGAPLMFGGDTSILLGITQQVALLPVFFFVMVLTVYHLSAGQVSVLTIVAFTFEFIWLDGMVGFLSHIYLDGKDFPNKNEFVQIKDS